MPFPTAVPDFAWNAPASPPWRRLFLVGDVHACARELEQLLAGLRLTGDDRVIFLGDLLDRGPEVRRTLDLVREVRGEVVLGNHEDKFLRWSAQQQGPPRTFSRDDPAMHLAPHHLETLDALRPADWELLRAAKLWIEIPEMELIAVHAGFRPGVALEDQKPYEVCRLQAISQAGVRRRWHTPRTIFWTQGWEDPRWVVYGHTHFRFPMRFERTLGLDTGCVFGGSLTALELPGGRLHRVRAAKNHAWELMERFYPKKAAGLRTLGHGAEVPGLREGKEGSPG